MVFIVDQVKWIPAPAPTTPELTPTVPDTGNALTNGTNLQTAINAAAIGDVIILKSGATYATASTSGFTFPAKGTGWDNRRVTIECSRIGELPAGTRVIPSTQSALFATVATSVKGPTLNFANARGYTLQGLDLSYTAACQTGASVNWLIDFTNAVADITFDRCWVHPLESKTNPSSIFRAVSRGLANVGGALCNFQILNSYIDGFMGWGYDHVQNVMAAIESGGGSHLRLRNTFIQGYRTWYLFPSSAGTQDVVIQRNTFDQPLAWRTLTDGSSGAPNMPDDHRELIVEEGVRVAIVGNRFTGYTNRGPLGIFFDQAGTASHFHDVLYLSNFADGQFPHLCEILLNHTPYSGSDVRFVNNLVRGGADLDGNGPSWANEFGGPGTTILDGSTITAGHGINALHNTLRGITTQLFHPAGIPSNYCDLRNNVSNSGTYWLNTAAVGTDYPNLNITKNLWINNSGGAPPSYIATDFVVADDAAAHFTDAAGADAGGAITGYTLTSSSPGYQAASDGTDAGCNITDLQAALDGTSTEWDYPELPRTLIDTTMPSTTGYVTKTVKASGGNFSSLNTAVNDPSVKNATTGIIVQIDAGLTLTENVTLPVHTNPWVIIQTSSGALPAAGTRVGPGNAGAMPKIQSTNSSPVLSFANSAAHYRFVGLELTSTTTTTLPALANVDSADQALGHMPSNITFDRCYIHAGASGNQRGVLLNCATGAVIESYLSGFALADRTDTQAVLTYSSTGPLKIVNNYLEASAENFMSGGADTPVVQLVPSDIEFRNNLCFKPLTWNPSDGSYAGILYAVKNSFELKNAQRVWVDGNTFQNYWVQDQNYCISLTCRNQSGTNPWARITDITFTHNRFINNTGGGFNITSDDDAQTSQQTDRVLIQYNDIHATGGGITTFHLTKGRSFAGVNHLVIDHNTCLASHSVLYFEENVVYPNFVFTNNIMGYGTYGGIRTIGGNALTNNIPAALALNAAGNFCRRNLYVGAGSDPLPSGDLNVATTADVQFTNLAGGDYTITSASPAYRQGYDGVSMGFDAY